MGLPSVGQPPEDNCYDCFYACKAAVRMKMGLWLGSVVGLGLAFGLVLRLGLVSGLYKWLFYLATVRQHKHGVVFN